MSQKTPLPEVVSPYLRRLIAATGGPDGPIGKQFLGFPANEPEDADADPLEEDSYETAPGMLYKYKGSLNPDGSVRTHGRVLWTVTRYCASYCRFCTRGRQVGLPATANRQDGATLGRKPFLSPSDILEGIRFLGSHPEINEVIVSGGDPLVSPEDYLSGIIEQLVPLQSKGSIDIIRIATRLPVSNPPGIREWHYRLLSRIRNPYLMVHINHPAELTSETRDVLTRFRRDCLASVLSQTVLLKDINNDVDILSTLFEHLAKEGVRPYYVFQCEPLPWARKFIVSPDEAVRLWQQVRSRLSGIAATAKFAIDVPHGVGKVIIPEGNAWRTDFTSYTDYAGFDHPFIVPD